MPSLSTSLCNSRRAAVAVQVALTMTVLLGMLAVVVDGGLLLAQRRQQQAAADATALAYAAAMANGDSSATAQASALVIAAANGAANDGVNSLITPNATDAGGNALHGIWFGPISGTFVGKAGASGYATGYVEVVIEYDQTRLFSAIWATTTLPVRARAVACWGGGTPNYWSGSILALGTAGTDVTEIGNAQISVPGSIIINANISTTDNGKITSTGGVIDYVGTAGGQSSSYSPAPNQVPTTTPDPLASLALPDPSILAVQSTSALNIQQGGSLQPGVYQGGISVSGGTVTLSPGIYYLEGGGLSLSGQATVTDNRQGVLIFNGETSGATNNPGSVGPISVSGQANLAITPMTSGTWQGISIFQDRNAAAQITVSGGSGTSIAGMIYAPDANATISSGGNVVPGTSFITNTLALSGNGTLTIPKSTVQVPLPATGPGGVSLVE